MTEEQIEVVKQQIKDEIISHLSIEIYSEFKDIRVNLIYAGEVISQDWLSLA